MKLSELLQENAKLIVIVLLVGVLTGCCMVLGYSGILALIFKGNDWSVRAAFGNSFGALNAILSFLAFSGMIVTLILQYCQINESRRISAAVNMPLPVLDMSKMAFGVDTSGPNAIAEIRSSMILKNSAAAPAIDVVCNARCDIGSCCMPMARALRAYVTNMTPDKFETNLRIDWDSVIGFLQELSAKGCAFLDAHSAYRSFLGACCAVSSKLVIRPVNDLANLTRIHNLLDPKTGLPAYSGVGALAASVVKDLRDLELTVGHSDAFSPVRIMAKDRHEHLAKALCPRYSSF